MPKTRPAYPPEFRRQMVDLVRAGRDPEDLARKETAEPTAQSIRNWVADGTNVDGRRGEAGDALTSVEQEGLLKLRRENKQLRLERDILSRATAWFARETNIVPSGSSITDCWPGPRPVDHGDAHPLNLAEDLGLRISPSRFRHSSSVSGFAGGRPGGRQRSFPLARWACFFGLRSGTDWGLSRSRHLVRFRPAFMRPPSGGLLAFRVLGRRFLCDWPRNVRRC